MVQVTAIRLVDDLDGGAADESVDFAIDNKHYEMDLSEQHAAQLRGVLAPFILAARRAGSSAVTRTRPSTPTRPSAAREDTAAIREWAGANGFDVSTRGRIAASVRAAYENHRAAPSTPPVVAAPAVEAEVKPRRRSRKKIADPGTAT